METSSEPPLHAPRICKCQNGYCEEDKNGDLYCNCFPEFRGQFCDIYIQRARVPALGNMAALLIPLTLLLVVLAAAAIYIVIRKRPFGKGTGLGGLTNSQSVSFRQGTNVEFGSPTFSSNGLPIGEKDLNHIMVQPVCSMVVLHSLIFHRYHSHHLLNIFKVKEQMPLEVKSVAEV
ncbi:uncharacterized protein LOC142318014 [Lycorma delicatula]|uniref:uncharacterized protein LOC142318014 n=2 Tax=Lycorma delicatula TaxID=130591 RepID=UPI003F5125E9